MSDALTILRDARNLIDTPDKWIQGAYADGSCFCAVGAIREAQVRGPGRLDAMTLLRIATGRFSIPEWNDAPERTHADVLAAFDKAIALAEEAADADHA